MTAALVIARMLTEGERAENPSPCTLSGPVYTCGHFMRFLWSDSYPIVKSPPNSKCFPCKPLMSETHSRRNWTRVNASAF